MIDGPGWRAMVEHLGRFAHDRPANATRSAGGSPAPAKGGGLASAMRPATPQEADAFTRRLADSETVRREAAVARYGPEAKATAPCEREQALHNGAMLLLIRGGDGRAPSLMGWTGGPAASLPMEVRREIATAVRMPDSVAATWAEYRHWQERAEVRAAFDENASPPLWVRARCALLEERLDTLPARDREDVLARLSWMADVLDLGFSRPLDQDEACLATLRRDIETGAVPLPEPAPDKDEADAAPAAPAEAAAPAASESPAAAPAPATASRLPDPGTGPAPVQLGHRHRSREEARDVVRILLGDGLSDREVARRADVSPSTVAAVRKAACAADE